MHSFSLKEEEMCLKTESVTFEKKGRFVQYKVKEKKRLLILRCFWDPVALPDGFFP